MRILFIILAAIVPLLTRAQGPVYSSNLGNTSTGSFAVAGDSWIAQEFSWLGRIVNGVMLTPPCTLNSVDLLMGPATGNPSGLSVSIYTETPGGPGIRLGTLTGDSDPRTPGVYTYTATGITLSPAKGYLIVVTSETTAADGAYQWSNAVRPSQTANDNLNIGYYADSADGSTWTGHLRQNVGLMAVYGTPVPEPSSCSVLLCAALCLVYARTARLSAPLRSLRSLR